jgi:response regulator RpfG family c-di-GMP phosphodiesterase
MLPEGADESLKEGVINAGVWDFFVRPVGIKEYQMRMRNVLRMRHIPDTLTRDTVGRESEIRDAIGEILLREYETLYVLGKAAEYKDEDTGSHILRVANYAKLIAGILGESETSQDVIYHSSALHDIGKIGIPDSILLKPARLDEKELKVMKTHTTNGHGILEHSASSYLLTGAMIALTHHERYDGSGYPMGLAGSDIPLYGRIVCIADVFDALTTKRPYKEPWSLERAFSLLVEQRGRQFDPALVDAFVCNSSSVENIYRDHSDY